MSKDITTQLACIVRGVTSIIKDIKQSYECALSSLND